MPDREPRCLIVEIAGARFVVTGEPLEWMARKGGYSSVGEMIADPDARKRFTLDQVMFAQEQSLNRATRRRR